MQKIKPLVFWVDDNKNPAESFYARTPFGEYKIETHYYGGSHKTTIFVSHFTGTEIDEQGMHWKWADESLTIEEAQNKCQKHLQSLTNRLF